MQKIKRKRILKFIRKAVEVLKPETYKAYHKYYEPQEEEVDGKKVIRFGFLEDHNVNHYRRCKYLYDKLGLIGVDAYLRLRGFQITNEASQG